MKRVVLGIVDTPAHADLTVRRLVALGFEPRDVSVLYPDRHGDHDFAFEAATKAPEGALAGIGFGALLGAIAALAVALAGLVPELGPLNRLAPVVAGLSGAALGALLFGVVGALVGLSIPEIEAKHYEGKVLVGTILLGVHANSRADVRRAREVFRSVAAADVHTTTESALPLST